MGNAQPPVAYRLLRYAYCLLAITSASTFEFQWLVVKCQWRQSYTFASAGAVNQFKSR
jgi:hypothetical protein